jgi:uncharacterized caspase-like protein
MRRWFGVAVFLAAFLAVVASAVPGAAAASRRVALLIGNGAYAHAGRLAETAGDVALLKAAFDKAGFASVMVATDLSREGMVAALKSFAQEAATSDIAVIYYDGLAMRFGEENYLLPVEVEGQFTDAVAKASVALLDVIAATSGARRLHLVIVDGARNVPYTRKLAARGECCLRFGLARIEPSEPDTIIAFAAKAGTVTPQIEGGSNFFVRALAAHLFEKGVDIDLALRHVREEVWAKTDGAQEPFAYGSRGFGQIMLGE